MDDEEREEKTEEMRRIKRREWRVVEKRRGKRREKELEQKNERREHTPFFLVSLLCVCLVCGSKEGRKDGRMGCMGWDGPNCSFQRTAKENKG